MEKLRGQRLIVGKNDRRAIALLDDLCHREGFPRASDAEEHLMALAIAHTVEELGDRVGLIAAWLVIAGKLEIHGRAALRASNLLCAAQFFIITHADKLDFAPITLIRHDQVEGYQGLS
jgi:hypothetical protein